MKNSKIIIVVAVILLLSALFFMAYDLFKNKKTNKINFYEYNIENLKQIDTALIKYSEVQQIKPTITNLKALAISQNDNIYVSGDNKILIYNNKGELQKEFATNEKIWCMTITKKNEIILGTKKHIEVWSSEGKKLQTWEVLKEKIVITSVAIQDSFVFVADAGNKIVYRYNLQGKFLNEIGREDKEQGISGFIVPSPYFDLSIGRDNELWVANTGRHSFESYTPEGRLISSWTRSSMGIDGFSGCCNPSHFAILSDGSFVCSEKGLVRIKIHDPSGEFNCVVATPKQFTEGTKGLDLAVNSKEQIVVLDPMMGLIRIFERN